MIRLLILILVLPLFIFSSCSKRLNKEPLSQSQKQNLALLQTDPQFVMYFNFKKMRDTEFWQKFISDSLFNNEKNFGNFLYTLKQATGSSITGGIDELYFSNTWIGENAIVIKGTFDKNRIDNYVKTDTNYKKINHERGYTVYKDESKYFYFYFRDDYTVFASNYLKQIESAFDIKDTSRGGLLTNELAMKTIENITEKEQLWMMTDQNTFIRGLFENLSNMNRSGKNSLPGLKRDTVSADTTANADFAGLYNKIKAVSFSIKMTDKLEINMQNECLDNSSASEVKNIFDGIIALARLSASLSPKKVPAILSLLDKVSINLIDNTVLLNLPVNQEQVVEIRKQKAL